MGKLIIYYILVFLYLLLSVLYVIKQIKRYRSEIKEYNQEELEFDFRSVVLNVLLFTILIIIISLFFVFRDTKDEKMTPGHIGIALACGTFIFYVVFLIWDILKWKINRFFFRKYKIHLPKKVIMGPNVIITISLISILLLFSVLSIIYSFN